MPAAQGELAHAAPVVAGPTWWTILRISLEERLVYRGDFALGTLMRFLPLVTQVFFWGAIFDGSRPQRPASPPWPATPTTRWSPTTC